MKTKSPWLMDALVKEGYKKTAPRQQVASILERHAGIFSVGDIIRAAKGLDKVSIYRTFDILTSLDLIHPIVNLEGVQYYELHGNTHHHHIVCTSCHRSACIDCDVPAIRVRGFQDTHHTFIVTALCNACAKKKK